MKKQNGKLALTRKESESITITTPSGETITVSVFNIQGSQVKLTIEADIAVEILRSELLAETE